MDRDGVLCLVGPNGDGQWLAPRAGAFDGVRALDGLWLETALADLPHRVSYQHGVDLVVDAVRAGDAVGAVLIRPVSVAEIERTAREGLLDAAEVDVLHAEAADRAGDPATGLNGRLSGRPVSRCERRASRRRCTTHRGRCRVRCGCW